MTKQERLGGIRRQLDLRGYRADRLNPGPRRDTHVAKMERLLTPARPRPSVLTQTARAAPSRCGSSPSAAKRKTLRTASKNLSTCPQSVLNRSPKRAGKRQRSGSIYLAVNPTLVPAICQTLRFRSSYTTFPLLLDTRIAHYSIFSARSRREESRRYA
jgi:hypothetical protein